MKSAFAKHTGSRVFASVATTCLLILLIPVFANEHLRFRYTQTVAHWMSKVRSPEVVFLGDSLTAGLQTYDLGAINLGSNGLHSYQIAANLQKALAYDPQRIVVIMGTNDAIRANSPPAASSQTDDVIDPSNEKFIRSSFTSVCREEKVVLVLAPATTRPSLNATIQQINQIAVDACRPLGTPIIELTELASTEGLLKKDYTTDGVHLNANGNQVILGKLDSILDSTE